MLFKWDAAQRRVMEEEQEKDYRGRCVNPIDGKVSQMTL